MVQVLQVNDLVKVKIVLDLAKESGVNSGIRTDIATLITEISLTEQDSDKAGMQSNDSENLVNRWI